jgi:hypothetical protein
MQIMTLKKLLLTFYPKPKTLFHMQTWKESTNLFIDIWCRSFVAIFLLASAAPSKDDPAIKKKTLRMHAIVLLEG